MKRLILSTAVVALFACNRFNKTENFTLVNESVNLSYVEDTAKEEEYEEPELFKGGRLCKSKDGCITIQSGIHSGSGTAPNFWAIWTITDSKGEKHELRFEESAFISTVHSLQKNDGTKYYIVECYAKASSIDGYEWLEAYRIIGDSIKEVNVLDGSYNIADNIFSINYDIPNWYTKANSIGYSWIFEYDDHSKNLYVPIVEERNLTDRYEIWHFNGNCFECQGVHEHKGLHESLNDYVCLIRYFTTEKYVVRVDSLDSQELRYASWEKPKTISDEPDIIIKGGKRQHYDISYDEIRRCDDYYFSNGSYEYIVNYCETTDVADGENLHQDYLLVKKGSDIIFKEKSVDN